MSDLIPYSAPIPRRRSVPVVVGAVTVGGDAPIVVQSMTNTDTADVKATTQQVAELWRAGSELVRVTVNNAESATAVPQIRDRLAMMGIEVPIIGDFHYNGHQLLLDEPACAEALAKYRINPGNVGFGRKKDAQFAAIVEMAIRYCKPVRIGVNWGSLDQSVLAQMMDENHARAEPWDATTVMREALIHSAIESARKAEDIGLGRDRIVLSCKVSGVQDLVAVYRSLAARCDYALHLGLTEAGMGSKGIVASTAALSGLLQEGIGHRLLHSHPRHLSHDIIQALQMLDVDCGVNVNPGIQQIVNVVVVIAGVYLIGDGKLSMGGLIACTMLTSRAVAPLGQMVGLLMQYHNAKVALTSLEQIMQNPVERPGDANFVHRPELKGNIEFRDVQFSCPN